MKLLSTAKAFGLAALLVSAASAELLDDFSGDPITGAKNGAASNGKGFWGPDANAVGADASVEFNVDGTYYDVQPITDDAACPREGYDEDGDGTISGAETGCYWGWSMEDGGYTANGLESRLVVENISAVANEWNYADAGYIYAFDVSGGTGETLREKGKPVSFSASDKVVITMNIPSLQKIKVKAFADDYVDGSGLPYYDITGSGSETTYEIAFSEFAPQWVGAPEIDPSKLDALFIGASSGGSTKGAAVPAAVSMDISIKSLCINDCGGNPQSLINAAQNSLIDMNITQEAILFAGVTAQTQVEVFNIAGEALVSENFSSDNSVSLQGLQNGVYVVRVNEAGKDAVSKKFSINK